MALKKRYIIVGAVLAVVVIVALAIGLSIGLRDSSSPTAAPSGETSRPVPTAPPDSDGPYSRAVVASDSGPCSEVGKEILQKNGSAVDIAVATMFCVGLLNMHSAGIGGGGFMLVYQRATRTAKVIDFREVAPKGATRDMYAGDNRKKALLGALAAGVPGEVKGYYTAWQEYGKLPWKTLVQPTIDRAKNGFQIAIPLHDAMESEKQNLKKDEGLRQLLLDEEGNLKKLGEVIKNPELAATLEKIRDNPNSFYNGSLAEDIAKDMEANQGIITSDDLQNYQAQTDKVPVEGQLGDWTWYTTPPPSSGLVLTMILNILKGYNFTEAARAGVTNSSLTYHRMVEAFKFAFARRSILGDPKFENISEVAAEMVDAAFAEGLRQKIMDDKIYPNFTYYGLLPDDHGTAHLSVLAPNGDAVSVTSTINYRLGGKFRSTKTGILYNNEMDDFSVPGSANTYGIAPSKINFIEPGKRPMSSICPIIFTNKNGDVQFIGGAAGGPMIITSVAQVVMSKLWFGRTLSEAVDEPRLHHQLLPPRIFLEPKDPYILSEAIQEGLRSRGHPIKPGGTSVVQAVSREKDGKLFGKSDPRKHGWPAGV